MRIFKRKDYMKVLTAVGIFAATACFAAFGKPVEIRVKPGESLAAVRDKVRALPDDRRAQGVEVVLESGRYLLNGTLDLDVRDGGAKTVPVVWRAADGARAVICDGVPIKCEAFRPVKDSAALSRMDAAAKDHVLVADLSESGFQFWKPRKGEMRAPTPVPELFVDGARMTLAQWPNAGEWTTIHKFIDRGTQDNDGSVSQGLGKKRNEKQQSPRGGTFGYAGTRPARWTRAGEVWLHGFWCFDWYDTVIPVASINTASNTITFAAKHTYGVRAGNPSPRRWKALHLLEELDVPGEYYVDPIAKKLYFWPVKKLTASSRVVVAGIGRNLVRIDKGANIVFRGIGFEECFSDAVALRSCENVAFERCVFRNCRGKAIYSQDCTG